MSGYIVAFSSGALFAAGFALSGVTRPEVVIGFLDFAGDWNPSLLLMMAAAIPVTFVLYRLTFRRQRPVLEAEFKVPTRRDIDGSLVGGAALYGVGWGLVGLCPGPVLASFGIGAAQMYLFLLAMIGGMLLFSGYENVRRRTGEDGSASPRFGSSGPAGGDPRRTPAT